MKYHSDKPEATPILSEIRQLLLALLQQLCEPAECVSVDGLAEAYLEHARQHCKTARKLEQNYRRYLAPVLGLLPASQVTPAAVMTLHKQLGERIGRATANHVLGLLRTMYNKAIRWGIYRGVNPCLSIEPFRLKSRERFLTAEEIHRLLIELGYCRNASFRSFIRLCLYTGARVSNIQAMRWQDVDVRSGLWRIPETKSGQPHVVPLLPEAIMAIESQRGKDPVWVLPGRGNTGHMVNPNRSWRRLIKRAQLDDLRLHDLRRTLGAWEAATGASLPIIAKTLGHTSLSATQIYARLEIAPVRRAMERAVQAMLTPPAGRA